MQICLDLNHREIFFCGDRRTVSIYRADKSHLDFWTRRTPGPAGLYFEHVHCWSVFDRWLPINMSLACCCACSAARNSLLLYSQIVSHHLFLYKYADARLRKQHFSTLFGTHCSFFVYYLPGKQPLVIQGSIHHSFHSWRMSQCRSNLATSHEYTRIYLAC